MNYRKENIPMKRKYSVQWRANETKKESTPEQNIQKLKAQLEEREKRILRTITNVNAHKVGISNRINNEHPTGTNNFEGIMMKIHEIPLSEDEELDHFENCG
jgi:hypothetical protein